MNKKVSERRLAENEAFFRNSNRKLQDGIDELDRIAEEDGVPRVHVDRDAPLLFICECSDETCRDRIKLSLNEYSAAHSKNDQFTIKCGHDIPHIEKVISEGPEYCTVRKHIQPPLTAVSLNKTPVKN